MQNASNMIKDRRSIRKYLDRPVPQRTIEEILDAARWAPSAHNAQPWRLTVLADKSVKHELAKAMAESWAEDTAKDGLEIEDDKLNNRIDRFTNAPVLILACLSIDDMNKFSDEKRQTTERDLAMQSIGAAIQNMLLTAHMNGLGTCWFCAPAFCKETVTKVLKIPDQIEPEALITMGYPAEKPPAPPRKLLADYCFKDKWNLKPS